MFIWQITIPASGLVQITNVTQGYIQSKNKNLFVQQLSIQNNATHSIRVGDTTVSATKGQLISPGTPGGAFGAGPFMNYNTMLSDWWIAGTSGDVIDLLCIE